jgi:MraZ protein
MLRGNQPTRIDEKGSDFFVTSLGGQSVRVYPLSVWQEIEQRLASTPAFNPTKKKFLDRANYFGQTASMDKQGRVLIPQRLRDAGGIAGEVAVLGKLDHLDVWNDERLRKELEGDPFTSEDEHDLGLMGV